MNTFSHSVVFFVVVVDDGFLCYVLYVYPAPHSFDYHNFVVSFEIGNFVFLFQDCLDCLGSPVIL